MGSGPEIPPFGINLRRTAVLLIFLCLPSRYLRDRDGCCRHLRQAASGAAVDNRCLYETTRVGSGVALPLPRRPRRPPAQGSGELPTVVAIALSSLSSHVRLLSDSRLFQSCPLSVTRGGLIHPRRQHMTTGGLCQHLDDTALGRYDFAGYEIRSREGLRLSLHLYRGGRHD